jgi:DNA-binding transcriptional ArsR family regulator
MSACLPGHPLRHVCPTRPCWENVNELGQAAGLSRSTVAAELARLRKQGAVLTTRRRVIITNLSRLRYLAESTEGNV